MEQTLPTLAIVTVSQEAAATVVHKVSTTVTLIAPVIYMTHSHPPYALCKTVHHIMFVLAAS